MRALTSGLPSTRAAIGRTAREATPGALRTAMCDPPIQNRDRISAPRSVERTWWMNQPTSTGASLAPSRAQIATASSLSGGQPISAGATNWIAPLSMLEPMYSLISDHRPM
ncbi:Uncharacterised protein [Mycobacterium tuberculosis]|nr:Uncharacterised protein [Mycobacterium tuberculosis]